jgi:hypothetical protein
MPFLLVASWVERGFDLTFAVIIASSLPFAGITPPEVDADATCGGLACEDDDDDDEEEDDEDDASIACAPPLTSPLLRLPL